MLQIRISELPSKTTTIDPNDLLEVSEWDPLSSTYISKKYEVSKVVPGGTHLTYNALLNQSGTLDPVETPLGLDTMGTITWTRLGTSVYNGNLIGAFPINKTAIYIQSTIPDALILATRINDDNIRIQTKNTNTNSFEDNLLVDTPIKIEVYP